MTDEHTAALKRARDSVRNAREILRSIDRLDGHEKPRIQRDLEDAEFRLNAAIDEEPKG